MGSSDFNIKITARLLDGRTVERALTVDEYFDPPDPGEVLECDSTPRFLEPARYVDEECDIEWLRLRVENRANSSAYVIEERFWGTDGTHRSAIVQSLQDGRVVDWEQTVMIEEQIGGGRHILKLGEPTVERPTGVRSHTLVEPREGGDEWKEIL